MCAEEQVFIDGQLLEHAATLRQLAHSHADQLMTGNLVYLVSVIDDGAALYRNEAHDALHRGGLARSVFPNQPHDGSAGEGQAHIPERKVPVRLAQPLYFNTICHN